MAAAAAVACMEQVLLCCPLVSTAKLVVQAAAVAAGPGRAASYGVSGAVAADAAGSIERPSTAGWWPNDSPEDS